MTPAVLRWSGAMNSNPENPLLTEPQSRHLLVNWQEIDRLLGEIESILTSASSKSVFPKYKPELSPVQANVIRDYVANIRREIVQSAKAFNMPLPPARLGPVHSIRVDLIFAEIAVEECTPERMRGYGEVTETAVPQLRGMVEQLKSSLGKLAGYLDRGGDLRARLGRLEQRSDELALLTRITDIVERRGMVEFRPAIGVIIEHLSSRVFEIAIFGRVSSGKSSLLNHILEVGILPVGVTPVTAVPTRVVYGPEPGIEVSVVGREAEHFALDRLAEFVSEQYNRGNEKRVTRVVAELPSSKLREGIVFVDTPGLGSLATEGAAETLAYLPRCDRGVLLIDSSSTLTEEDIGTIRMMLEAGIPASVLLSKADLVKLDDREQATRYTREKIQERLGVEIPVRPVSVEPGADILLDAWFSEEIAPIYQQHRELASESIRRKIGVLRDSVQSALRMMLGHDDSRNDPGSDVVQNAARKLRNATGSFDAVSQRCFELISRLHDSAPLAIGQIAREAALLLRSNSRREVSGEWIGAAAQRFAAQEARGIPEILTQLAQDSAAALIECARDLEAPSAPGPSEFAASIQEMPLLDIAKTDIVLHSGILGKHWTRLATGAFEAKLTEAIGAALSQAFNAWSSVLGQWLRTSLKKIRDGFDAYAESYRATIVRLEGAGGDRDAPDREMLTQDLAELEETDAVPIERI